jgi:hypothetical protein
VLPLLAVPPQTLMRQSFPPNRCVSFDLLFMRSGALTFVFNSSPMPTDHQLLAAVVEGLRGCRS